MRMCLLIDRKTERRGYNYLENHIERDVTGCTVNEIIPAAQNTTLCSFTGLMSIV